MATTLTVAAGPGGSARAAAGGGAEETVAAGSSKGLPFSVEATATLVAVPASGHEFSGWELSPGTPACAAGGAACMLAAGRVGPAAATATFTAVQGSLGLSVSGPERAGAVATAAFGGDSAPGEARHDAAFMAAVAVTALAGVVLEAAWSDGYAFSGWRLSAGLSCAAGLADNPCTLAADLGALDGTATAEAAFTLVATTLTVAAGPGGSARAAAGGGAEETVAAGSSKGLPFSVEATATLVAVPASGHEFSGWELSPGTPACAAGGAACMLAAGRVGPAAATATFTAVQGSLGLSVSGPERAGAVATAAFGGDSAPGEARHDAAFMAAVAVTALAGVVLEAAWSDGYAFSGWRLSAGLSCAAGLADNPCTLAADLGALDGTATAEAAFTLVATTLTVAAGPGGSARAAAGGGAEETVAAGSSKGLPFSVEATATLVAVPASGHEFSGWELSPGTPACAAGGAACMLAAGRVGPAAATATFTAVQGSLGLSVSGPERAGAVATAAFGGDSAPGEARHDAAFMAAVAVTALAGVVLEAAWSDGYAFSGWRLSAGLSCAAGLADNPCTLAADLGALDGTATAEAAFTLVATTLTVAAGPGGSARAAAGGGAEETVAAGSSKGLPFSVEATATLVAVPASGHEFSGWELSPGTPACAAGGAACMLAAGRVGPAAATATFTAVQGSLGLSVSGPERAGAVATAAFGGDSAPGEARHDAAFMAAVAVTALAGVVLEAAWSDGYAFSGWRLSAGLSCAAGLADNPCTLAADLGALDGTATAEAAFTLVATTLTVAAGPGGSARAAAGGGAEETVAAGSSKGLPFSVEATATLVAVPASGHEFSGWELSPGTPACAAGGAACMLAAGRVGPAAATATFTAVQGSLGLSVSGPERAGAVATAAFGGDSAPGEARHDAAFMAAVAVTALAGVVLEAAWSDGYAFSGWRLSAGLSCAAGLADNPCTLAADLGALDGTATAEAAFTLVATTLTVAAGPGGSARAAAGGGAEETVAAGTSKGLPFSVEATATLVAVPASGHEFSGWELSPGTPACAAGGAACMLAAGRVGPAAATATFTAVQGSLGLSVSGPERAGAVATAAFGGDSAPGEARHDAAFMAAVAVTALAGVVLEAAWSDGYAFSGWRLSAGLSCAAGLADNPCTLAADLGALDGTATAEAAFTLVATTLTVAAGPGGSARAAAGGGAEETVAAGSSKGLPFSVEATATLVAVPASGHEFSGWELSPGTPACAAGGAACMLAAGRVGPAAATATFTAVQGSLGLSVSGPERAGAVATAAFGGDSAPGEARHDAAFMAAVAVTALAGVVLEAAWSDGYAFSGWRLSAGLSCAAGLADNPCTLAADLGALDGTATAEAAFTLVATTLTVAAGPGGSARAAAGGGAEETVAAGSSKGLPFSVEATATLVAVPASGHEFSGWELSPGTPACAAGGAACMLAAGRVGPAAATATFTAVQGSLGLSVSGPERAGAVATAAFGGDSAPGEARHDAAFMAAVAVTALAGVVLEAAWSDGYAFSGWRLSAGLSCAAGLADNPCTLAADLGALDGTATAEAAFTLVATTLTVAAGPGGSARAAAGGGAEETVAAGTSKGLPFSVEATATLVAVPASGHEFSGWELSPGTPACAAGGAACMLAAGRVGPAAATATFTAVQGSLGLSVSGPERAGAVATAAFGGDSAPGEARHDAAFMAAVAVTALAGVVLEAAWSDGYAFSGWRLSAGLSCAAGLADNPCTLAADLGALDGTATAEAAFTLVATTLTVAAGPGGSARAAAGGGAEETVAAGSSKGLPFSVEATATLVAVPASGHEFSGWELSPGTPACAAGGAACMLAAGRVGPAAATATFTAVQGSLGLSVSGPERAGAVATAAFGGDSAPGEARHDAAFMAAVAVTALAGVVLEAAWSDGYAFSGWRLSAGLSCAAGLADNPCTLAADLGALDGTATAEAAFTLVATTLTVAAGPGGSARAAAGGGAEETVAAGSSKGLPFSVEATATLVAVPASGHEFSGWELSPGTPACAAGGAACMLAAGRVGPAAATATFTAVQGSLGLSVSGPERAGAVATAAFGGDSAPGEARHDAAFMAAVAVTALAGVVLEAAWSDGYAFSGWRLSAGLSCAAGLADNPCTLAADLGALDGTATAEAAFTLVATTLTVAAGPGGSARAAAGGGAEETVAAGTSKGLPFSVEATATLVAVPASGHEFSGWELSPGTPACAAGGAACMLAAGRVGPAAATATFTAVQGSLGLSVSGPERAGAVATAAFGGDSAPGEARHDAAFMAAVAVTALAGVVLEAAWSDGYAFSGWRLSAGLSCAAGLADNPCTLAADLGALDGTATAEAAFTLVATTLTVAAGPGGSARAAAGGGAEETVAAGTSKGLPFSVEATATLVAVPASGHEFSGWELSPGTPACAAGGAACMLAAGRVGPAAATATFTAVQGSLGLSVSGPERAGAVATAAFGGDSAPGEARHDAAFMAAVAVTALAGVVLEAAWSDGYAFSGWRLSAGLSCAAGLADNPCTLAADLGALDGTATAEAAFTLVATTLTVAAGPGGSARAAAGGGAEETVAAGTSKGLPFSVEATATLVAVPASGHEFSGWELSPGTPACAAGGAACMLAAGRVGPAAATATFTAVQGSLGLSVSGPERAGAVATAAFGGDSAPGEARHDAAFMAAVAVTALAGVVLEAAWSDGYAFSGWRLSAGLSCAAGLADNPCTLAADLGALDGTATAEAAFTLVATTLTVAAGPGGSARAAAGGGAEETVAAGTSKGLPFSVEATATLVAVPASGHEFSGWELSPGTPACAAGGAACMLAAGRVGPAAATATFTAVQGSLGLSVSGPERAGAVATAAFGGDSAPGEARHDAAFMAAVAVTALAGVVLEAAWSDGYAFSGWRLSAGLSCAAGLADNPCTLAADLGALDGTATAEAAFTLVATTLTVAAGPGGSARAAAGGGAEETVAAGTSKGLPFSVEATATLVAVPASGHEFSGWELSPGTPACAAGGAACMLAAGRVGPAAATATFTAVGSTLTLASGPGGSVNANSFTGRYRITHSRPWDVPYSLAATLTLTATPDYGWRFAGWTPPARLACSSVSPGAFVGPLGSAYCVLSAGSARGAATRVEAAFELVATTLTVAAGLGGSVEAVVAGAGTVTVTTGSERGFPFSIAATATLTPVSEPGWRFAFWALSNERLFLARRRHCADGPTSRACAMGVYSVKGGVSRNLVDPNEGGQVVAVFRRDVDGGALTVAAAGANGYATLYGDGGPRVQRVPTILADSSWTVPFADLFADLFAGLDALPGILFLVAGERSNGYQRAGWTLSASEAGDVRAGAAFEAVPATLTVVAGPGGSVEAAAAAGTMTVTTGSERGFSLSAESAALTLTAVPEPGWRFAGWTLVGPLVIRAPSCMSRGAFVNPCVLQAGYYYDARAEAVFGRPVTLTVVAGAYGPVSVYVPGPMNEGRQEIDTGSERDFEILVEDRQHRRLNATLEASIRGGYRVVGWRLSGGLACVGVRRRSECELGLRTGSVTGDARAEPIVEAFPSTLTVVAGANGSVAAEVGGADAVTVATDSSQGFAFSVEASATLTATAATGYRFTGWTLSNRLACAEDEGTESNICALPAGSVIYGVRVEAAFSYNGPVTLTVAAGANGSVEAEVAGAGTETVTAGSSRDFHFPSSAEATATLTAVPDTGYAFAGWRLSGGLSACHYGPGLLNPCALEAGSVMAAEARVEAVFAGTVTLTVASDPSRAGIVGVRAFQDRRLGTVYSGSELGFELLVSDVWPREGVTQLSANPQNGWRFTGWTLSEGLACADGRESRLCELEVEAGSVMGDARAEAVFALVPSTLTVSARAGGSVRAAVAGADAVTVGAGSSMDFPFSRLSTATLTAVPDAGYVFDRWSSSAQFSQVCALSLDVNPCRIPINRVSRDTLIQAFFEAAVTLTVAAGEGGSVEAAVAGTDAVTVGEASERDLTFTSRSAAMLTATASGGYAFAGWTLSGPTPPACVDGLGINPCSLPAGSVTDGATVSAAFDLVATTLTVSAAVGGSVRAEVAGAAAVTVGAGSSMDFPFSAEATATLTAVPDTGYAFTGWTLPPDGLACASGARVNPCALPAGSVTADATVSAAFEPGATLTVAAGANGSVEAEVAGAEAVTVGEASERDIAIINLSAATLTATASGGYAFAGWTLSGPTPPACVDGPGINPCALPAGSVTDGATVSAAFGLAATALAVSAAGDGSVRAEVAGAGAVTVGAGPSMDFPFSIESTATLTAVPDDGHEFYSWRLSAGLSCAGGADANPCVLAAGSVTADARAEAVFSGPVSLRVLARANGSVGVAVAGADTVTFTAGFSRQFVFDARSTVTLVAVPDDGYAFDRWQLPYREDGRRLSCAGGGRTANPCVLEAGSLRPRNTTSPHTSEAFFTGPVTLTVGASANGEVEAAVAGADTVTVTAGSQRGFGFNAEATTTLVAVASDGYRFGAWALSGGLPPCSVSHVDCAPDSYSVRDRAAGAGRVDGWATAVFRHGEAAALTVAGVENGRVDVSGLGRITHSNDRSQRFLFADSGSGTPELYAFPAAGYHLARWNVSPGSAIADARVEAVFELAPTTLTVAGVNGSVDAFVAGAATVTVTAGSERAFVTFSEEGVTATLTATEPVEGYAFAAWVLSTQFTGNGWQLFQNSEVRTANPYVVSFSGAITRQVEAVFGKPVTLTVGGGAGGVRVNGGSRGFVGRGSEDDFDIFATDPPHHMVVGSLWLDTPPFIGGYRFSRWKLSAGLACRNGLDVSPCTLLAVAGSVTADARAEPVFDVVPATLTVVAGANGSVEVAVAGADTVTVTAGSEQDFRAGGSTTATVVAVPAPGYRFGRWTGPSCARFRRPACALSAETDRRVEAIFGEPVTLTVTINDPRSNRGSVYVSTSDGTTQIRSTRSFGVSTESDVELRASAFGGYYFAGWKLSAGLACEERSEGNAHYCELALAVDAQVEVVFKAVTTTLTVAAGANGSVEVTVAGADTVTVTASSEQDFHFSVEATATLTAVPGAGYVFTGWTESPVSRCTLSPKYRSCDLRGIRGDYRAEPVFEAAVTLTAAAGEGGSVEAAVAGTDAVTVGEASERDLTVTSMSAATLTATASAGHAFAGWTLSGPTPPACVDGPGINPCALPAGSVTDGATVSAAFDLVATTLTVSTAVGGSVRAEVAGAAAVTVGAGSSMDFPFSILSTATLTAVASAGYVFTGWMLPPDGLACASGARANPCALPAGSVTADATVSAAFEPGATLTVAAGANGSVEAEVAGAEAVTVGEASERDIAIIGLSAATLTATASDGYAFAGWTLSGPTPPACVDGPGINPCSLPAGSVTADATVSAAFDLVATTLAVRTAGDGSVRAEVAGAGAVTVGARSQRGFGFNAEATATLTAVPAPGHEFYSWRLSGGLSCAGGADANPCVLAAGSVTADARAEAVFSGPVSMLVLAGANGSVEVTVAGADTVTVTAGFSRQFVFDARSTVTLVAVPDDGYAFDRWQLPRGEDGHQISCAGGGWTANPCVLEAGSLRPRYTSTHHTSEAFFTGPVTLTVGASANGEVEAAVAGADTVTVTAGSQRGFGFNAEAMATLVAVASDGYRFGAWALSGGLPPCSVSHVDCAPDSYSVRDRAAAAGRVDGWATAVFRHGEAAALTVAGVENGNIRVSGVGRITHSNDSSQRFLFADSGSGTPVLYAFPAAGYRLARWNVSPGSAIADARVEAVFELAPTTLTVAGVNGSVDAFVAGAATVTVTAGSERAFVTFSEEGVTATLTATEPVEGYAFAAWVLSTQSTGNGWQLFQNSEVRTANPYVVSFSGARTRQVEAVFGKPVTLTVAAGVSSVLVNGGSRGFVGRGSEDDFDIFATDPPHHMVVGSLSLDTPPFIGGYRFSRWKLSAGLACRDGLDVSPCTLLAVAGSVTADARAEPVFDVVPATLTVVAGANGSVEVAVAGADTVTVTAGSEQDFRAGGSTTATVVAVPAPGYRFGRWTGPSCARFRRPACALSAETDRRVEAIFGEPVTLTVTIANDPRAIRGSVSVVTSDGRTRIHSTRRFGVSAESAVGLRASAFPGYYFAGWKLSAGLACKESSPGDAHDCQLVPDSVIPANAWVEVVFEPLETTLTVVVGANGSVEATVAGAGAVTLGAGSSMGFPFSVAATATLKAVPDAGYAFAGWTGSYLGLPGTPVSRCSLSPTYKSCNLRFIVLGYRAEAVFLEVSPPAPWRGPGSVLVSGDGATHTAVPHAANTFERWEGAPCQGSKNLECDVSSAIAGGDFPAAVFLPFAVDGIKSLAFGLGYHGDAPDHFRVSFQEGMGTGFTPVPGLERLDPDSGPARLAVSVHLLPWGLGTYMTEVCNPSDNCMTASGGERTLAQADSAAATGYFKAPDAGRNDEFGTTLALSAAGATLAVGARGYDGQDDYDNAIYNGDVYIYRRSGFAWSFEAFVKAPVADSGDNFGHALALSADGGTLAVGAPGEDSAYSGTFAPGDPRYQTALDSNYRQSIGAVYVYRRSVSTWRVEAFIKAPDTTSGDSFGLALALSADGDTLAVGAPGEDSAYSGTFVPDGPGYQAALNSGGASNSGAVAVYHRWDWGWGVSNFIKAPVAGAGDRFGLALALSADGVRLAVGAPGEDSSSAGAFTFTGDVEEHRAALDSDGATDSGAVTVYYRSGSVWALDAFVKAPNAVAEDRFGGVLALSGDGATLAVGARHDDSASTGTFAPGDAGSGYQDALDSNGAGESGAAIVYRYSGSVWRVEAFIKAPVAGDGDLFGTALALSKDGSMLAVSAPGDDSAFFGVFASGGLGYQDALDSNGVVFGGGGLDSGAVAVYHRSTAGRWTAGNFVKAPKIGYDNFASPLALSADGATLAVGAPNEDGGALPQPVGGDFHDTENFIFMPDSGAVYLY